MEASCCEEEEASCHVHSEGGKGPDIICQIITPRYAARPIKIIKFRQSGFEVYLSKNYQNGLGSSACRQIDFGRKMKMKIC
jgi:hypothetical protein